MNPEIYESNFSVDGYSGLHVDCPVCGHPNCHIGEVRQGTHISNGNQGNVSIEFIGECDHRWLLIFSGHKGDVYYTKAVIKETAHLFAITPRPFEE
jgi:hypothetical protein